MTSSSDLLTLNVGGSLYTTSVSTLTKFDESPLADIAKRQRTEGGGSSTDSNNNVFIDRDGPTFRHVLNFLRTGQLSLPADFRDLDLLESEAEFYRIQPLVEAAREVRAGRGGATGGGGVSSIRPGGGYLELYENCVDESVFVIAEKKTIDTLPVKWKSSHFNLPVYMANIGLFGNSYQFAGFGTKLMLIDHLLTSGWTMASTSFSCFADRKDALPKAVNRYIWHRPAGAPSPHGGAAVANGPSVNANGASVEASV